MHYQSSERRPIHPPVGRNAMSQATATFARAYTLPTTTTIPLAPLAGRILLSTIFILSGVMKLADWQGTTEYMASKELPLIPLLLPIAAIVEIVGGLAVLLGGGTRGTRLAC